MTIREKLGARGYTLLEIMIATGVAVLLGGLVFSLLISVQRQTADALANERASSRTRLLLDLLERELLFLNLTPADLEPDAPNGSTELEYRKVIGYDKATKTVLLDPPGASGTFMKIALVGSDVVRTSPTGTITLAAEIYDLRFTLNAPDRLLIAVAARTRDSQGSTVQVVAEKTVFLRNRAHSGTN